MSKVDGLQQIRRGAEEILVESELVDLLEIAAGQIADNFEITLLGIGVRGE